MGYDVHITRAADWTEAELKPITLDEWRAFVAADPEMRLDGFAEAAIPSGTLRMTSPGLAVWTAYSGHGVGGNMAWFDHSQGCIDVKDPDDEILGKMRCVAAALGASVIGDEGESY